MKKTRKNIPVFKRDQDEFDFWASRDSLDYLNDTDEVSQPLEMTKRKMPKRRITMLLDPRLKTKLEKIAEEKGIPYQTLIQIWLREKVNEEIKRKIAS